MFYDELDVGEVVVSQFQVGYMPHAMNSAAFDNVDRFVSDALLGKGQDLLLFLVDLLHFVRDDALPLGPI